MEKPRNFVQLALQKRANAGSGSHTKSNKANRNKNKIILQKQIKKDLNDPFSNVQL